MALEASLAAASRPYPLPPGFRPSYGTAGFRAVADLLHSTMFRWAGSEGPPIRCCHLLPVPCNCL